MLPAKHRLGRGAQHRGSPRARAPLHESRHSNSDFSPSSCRSRTDGRQPRTEWRVEHGLASYGPIASPVRPEARAFAASRSSAGHFAPSRASHAANTTEGLIHDNCPIARAGEGEPRGVMRASAECQAPARRSTTRSSRWQSGGGTTAPRWPSANRARTQRIPFYCSRESSPRPWRRWSSDC